jgi:hypothetical protein
MRKISISGWIVLIALTSIARAAEPAKDAFAPLSDEYATQTHVLLAKYCLDCHATASPEGELDLEQFGSLADVRRQTGIWLKVAEMLDNGEMPPKDSDQPSADERQQLRGWIKRYLDAEALATAGDPGPVVLRRLNNAQYTYTVRDLTGVELSPAREFPTDSAAGEGFTNTGAALVMSPALFSKYLEAGKEIADHAVLLPDGFRFSPATSRRDWADEALAGIRSLYRLYTEDAGATEVQLQGLNWETNKGGRLPVEKYLDATLAESEALKSGAKSIDAVASERGLNAKYLGSLWNVLNADDDSQLLNLIRKQWSAAKAEDAPALAAEVGRWQAALSSFQSVGHMKNWMNPIEPLVGRQEVRIKIPRPADGSPATGNEVKLYLAAGAAGDGANDDLIVWENPRLVSPGRPDLPLRDLRGVTRELAERRERFFAATARALTAAEDAGKSDGDVAVDELAKKHSVDVDALAAWLDYLGVGVAGELKLDHLTNKIESSAGYAFAQGWGANETPNLVTNASDQHVRIPGNLKPHGVVVHPSPTLLVGAGWRSPVSANLKIEGQVTHAHPECGNGVTWSLELARGRTRQTLASGISHGATPVAVGPVENIAVRPGDLVSLLIGARDGNHGCDLTDIELALSSADGAKTWSLSGDVASDVLAGNPHADRLGNANVWHFYTRPVQGSDTGATIPAGSLLARWQSTEATAEKQSLAEQVEKLLTGGPPADAAHPDALLYRQLTSLGGPLFARAAFDQSRIDELGAKPSDENRWGLEPSVFGRRADGTPIDSASLSMRAPAVLEISLPADLVAEMEFVATAVVDPMVQDNGAVQVIAGLTKPEGLESLRADLPVLAADGSPARQKFAQSFADFREWFPRALCYVQIVPVDEVVTLTLFHREDEPLRRLMLNEQEQAELDRLWSELHFVSHDALTLVDAFQQLMEFATQDSDPGLFEPYRKPIHDRAASFRQELIDAEPRHVAKLLEFAAQAYRRPLAPQEAVELQALYQRLRDDELPHEEALRFTMARVLVSPAFLYRLEQAAPGEAPGPVSNDELASRLSYFLWSSLPDEPLLSSAADGSLDEPDVLVAQARRMLADPRARRLATEFACQWLQVYDFDTLDEKSETHFPEFAGVRGDLYEETIRFFTELFQKDGSVLSILDADHVFVNESLAKFYGIPGVSGADWRRVDGAAQYSRGGILALGSTLAKNSGASRTSPTLRGTWVSEVLLGEKLPKPPPDVPQLPEDEAAIKDLTVRQLVEKHASDVRCAGCHVRVDPLGFSLEAFDTIGRHRERDLADRPIDAKTKLADGTELEGVGGLRNYLLTTRRDTVLRQFCKKLLGYALGRGVQLSDQPLIDEMQQQLAAHDYRFSAAVETIVRSPQFRQIRGQDAEFPDSLTADDESE